MIIWGNKSNSAVKYANTEFSVASRVKEQVSNVTMGPCND